MVMMTTPQLGQDRARPTVSSHATQLPMYGNWRDGSAAPSFCRSTGLSSDTAVVPETNFTVGARKQTIQRPARHLGTRST